MAARAPDVAILVDLDDPRAIDDVPSVRDGGEDHGDRYSRVPNAAGSERRSASAQAMPSTSTLSPPAASFTRQCRNWMPGKCRRLDRSLWRQQGTRRVGEVLRIGLRLDAEEAPEMGLFDERDPFGERHDGRLLRRHSGHETHSVRLHVGEEFEKTRIACQDIRVVHRQGDLVDDVVGPGRGRFLRAKRAERSEQWASSQDQL